MLCPDCNHEIKGAGNNYSCANCAVKWKVSFSCEVCGSVPKQSSSCGSVSFFCEKCKKLKSRELMDKEFLISSSES
jgi:zinc-ribbons